MEKIFGVASSINSGISLVALVILVLYGVYKLIFKNHILSKVSQKDTAKLINKIINWVGLIAFVSLILVLSPAVINSFKYTEISRNRGVDSLKNDQQSVMRPEISVDLRFPYERVNESVKLNKLNPKLIITNRGSKTISPIKADVVMFMLNQTLDKVIYAGILSYQTHGHSIFEPELKPGLSASASLPGVKNWANPAAYSINIEVIIPDEKKIPDMSFLYLVDKNSIKVEGSKLSESTANKIKAAIQNFEKNEGKKKKVTINSPMDGVWVPHAEPGVNFKLNEGGTLTVLPHSVDVKPKSSVVVVDQKFKKVKGKITGVDADNNITLPDSIKVEQTITDEISEGGSVVGVSLKKEITNE